MKSSLLYIFAVFCCAISVVLGQQVNLDSLIQRSNDFTKSGQFDFGIRDADSQIQKTQQPQQKNQQQVKKLSNYCGNPFGRLSRCGKFKPCFSGYANAACEGRYPPPVTPAALLQWNKTDTADWSINPVNNTELILRNSGVWTINLKAYATVFAVDKAQQDTITQSLMQVALVVNGKVVSGATDEVTVSTYSRDYDSLSVAYTNKFFAGDRLQVAVVSSNYPVAFFLGASLSMAETSCLSSCRSASCRRRY